MAATIGAALGVPTSAPPTAFLVPPAAFLVPPAAFLVPPAAFLVISAIAVLVKLRRCVTELLIIVIWVFFPDLHIGDHTIKNCRIGAHTIENRRTNDCVIANNSTILIPC